MLEMFDFFANANNGVLKSRTTLVSFFTRNAVKLSKALSLDFLTQMQLIINNKRVLNPSTTASTSQAGSTKQPNSKTTNNSEMIRIYDPIIKTGSVQSPVIIERPSAPTGLSNFMNQ
jgi:hypothetical protein